MDLDLVLIKHAELRTVVEAYEQVLQEIASKRLYLEHLVVEEDIESFQTRLSHLHSTYDKIKVYLNETLKLDISGVRELVSKLKSNVDIYTNTFDDLSSIKEARKLLKQGGHFDDDEGSITELEYIGEMDRLSGVLSDVFDNMKFLIGEKE